jgi:hypothetical protein
VQLSEALARLRTTPEFQAVIEAAESKRPFLSPINLSKPVDEQFNRYVYSSGQVNGFEAVFNLLKGSK